MKLAALIALFLEPAAQLCQNDRECSEPKPHCDRTICVGCFRDIHCEEKGLKKHCSQAKQCDYPTCFGARHECGSGKVKNMTARYASCPLGRCTDDICCEANICVCEHGTADTGEDCSTNGAIECKACNKNYHLEGNDGVKSCEANICVCEHGTADAGKDCSTDGAIECKACNENYHLEGNDGVKSCEANICVCDHGTADAGKDCSTDGAIECTACNENYHLEGSDGAKSCEANICVCEHGTADAGKDCSTDGAIECRECNENYHLEGNDGAKSCKVDSCKTPTTLAEKHIQEVTQSKTLTKTGFAVVLECMHGYTPSIKTEVNAVECVAHGQAYKLPAEFTCDIMPASPRVENSAGSSQQNAGLKVATTTKSHDPRSVAARSSAQSDGTSWLISVIMAASLVALCLFLWWRFWHMRGDSSRRSSSAAEDLESPSDYSARHGPSRRPSRRRASQRNESEEVCGTQMPDRPRLASRDGARARSRTASMMSSIPQRRSVTCSERALVGEASGGTTRKNTNEMYGASDGARGAEELTESAQKSARKAGGARTPWPREADPEATSRRIDRLDSNGRDVRFDSNPYKFKRQAIVKRDDSMFGERSCYLCENKEHAHRSKNSHHKPQKKADHIGAKCTTRQDVAI